MKRVSAFIALLVGAFTVAIPAYAQSEAGWSIVPEACRDCPAAWQCVIDAANNLVAFAVYIGIFIVVVVIAYAGVLLVLSPTNPESKGQAKKMLINAVIGLVIVLASWLIVDKILETLGAGGVNEATAVLGTGGVDKCITAKNGSVVDAPPDIEVPGGTVDLGSGCPGANCAALPAGVSCEAHGCKADAGLATALGNIDSSVGWAVTEAYPPGRAHKAACHTNGTCVDVGLRPRTYNVETVTAFYNAARSAGLRPVFESLNSNLVNELKKNGINALYLPGWISADHFSVYGK